MKCRKLLAVIGVLFVVVLTNSLWAVRVATLEDLERYDFHKELYCKDSYCSTPPKRNTAFPVFDQLIASWKARAVATNAVSRRWRSGKGVGEGYRYLRVNLSNAGLVEGPLYIELIYLEPGEHFGFNCAKTPWEIRGDVVHGQALVVTCEKASSGDWDAVDYAAPQWQYLVYDCEFPYEDDQTRPASKYHVEEMCVSEGHLYGIVAGPKGFCLQRAAYDSLGIELEFACRTYKDHELEAAIHNKKKLERRKPASAPDGCPVARRGDKVAMCGAGAGAGGACGAASGVVTGDSDSEG